MKRETEKERTKHPRQPVREESRTPDSPRSDAFSLQRHAGNQAVLNLIHSDVAQPNLGVSQPNDPDEREAARVAEQVNPGGPSEDSPSSALPDTSHGAGSKQDASVVAKDRLLPSLGPGQPLDTSLRKTMEKKVGADLREVRIHSGTAASAMAQSLDARAFTVGNDVVFNSAEYAPSTLSGRRLIVHELTHVAQNQKTGDGHGGARPTIKRESIVGKATSYLLEKKEQAGKAIDAKKWEIYRGMIAAMKASKNFTVRQLRSLVPKLPQSIQSAASSLIDALDFTVDIINALLLAIIGLAVGFVSGIVDLVVGIVRLVLGLLQLLVDALVAMLGKPKDLEDDWNDLKEAVGRIPQGIKQAAGDWLERYKRATLEEQVLMGGELVGQIEAFIATFALAGTKAGQAGSLTIRTGSAGVRVIVMKGGVAAMQEAAPATVTIAIPAVVPKTAAEAAVVSSQALMMSAQGPQGGPGGSSGGGSSGGGEGPAPKKPATKTPEPSEGKETGTQQERRLLREDQSRAGGRPPNGPTYHAYEGRATGSFNEWISRLQKHMDSIMQDNPNRPKLNTSPLGENADSFINRHPNLKAQWDRLNLPIDEEIARLNSQRAAAAGDKVRIKELDRLISNLEKSRFELNDFEANTMGKKRPDLVELFFERQRAVVTDITQRTGDPFHNFKTQAYVELLKEVLQWDDVNGVNFNTPFDQNVTP
jgi:hypothetical protein